MARIIVVGAGIIGLSVARSAARRGHAVTLIERGPVPNPRQASWDSHRMIRHHYGEAAGYTRMVSAAFTAWDRLWQDLGAVHFANTGAIAIAETEGDYAHRTLATFRAIGLPHRLLGTADLTALCPQYRLGEASFGVLADPGGPLFADRIVRDLAALVATLGVTIMPDTDVAAIDPAAPSVTLSGGAPLAADAIVVAAGAWAGRLWPSFAGLPVMRQALCYVEPPAAHADAWRTGPALVAFGDHGGYALPPVDGTGLKFGLGAHRRPGSPERDGWDGQPGEEAAILAGFGRFVRDIAGYAPLRVQVGYYMMDASRAFRVETVGRAIGVGNCDGQMFKFGPLLGERIAAAIDGEIGAADLAAWAAGGAG